MEVLLHKIDRRAEMRRASYPFNCIGILSYTNSIDNYLKIYRGSGFLISPNLVITAAHFMENYRKIGSEPMRLILNEYEDDKE